MNKKQPSIFAFALFPLVIIPAMVHLSLQGAYVLNPQGYQRTFWIGPISTTMPYVALSLLFLFHATSTLKRKDSSLFTPYLSASLSWLSMMSFTLFLTNQAPGPASSSTMVIAVILTPLFYIPFLIGSYAIGTILGLISRALRETNER